MNIVVLDKISFSNNDVDLSAIKNLGNVTFYDVLPTNDVVKACRNAEIVICNKTVFDKDLISKCPKLKYIGLTATGYNNVDLLYAKQKGVTVTNVPGYSTVDVAQHVFAYVLHYSNKISEYDASVKDGDWLKSKTFCYFNKPLMELDNKTIGIIGYGSIGKKVAEIASAFGMRVLVYNRSKKDMPYTQVDKETVFKESDFLTLHCPLNEETSRLVNKNTILLMKKSAVLINTARGGVVDEIHLANALNNEDIAHAYIDVLTVEPMQQNCPLKDAKNVTFTPHIAWAPQEARQRLIKLVAQNVACYLNNKPINVVNK